MALHYKRDGTLDMRFSSSKAAVSSGFGGMGSSGFGGMGSSGFGGMGSSGFGGIRSSGGAGYSPMSSGFASSGLHHKKDGTLDMRYNSSRLAASPSQPSYVSRPPSSSGLHHKKDGTLDMRYSSSRSGAASATPSNHINRPPSSSGLHYKKDGTMDMRYNSSQLAASSATFNQLNRPSDSSGLHHKKDGTLDMRYSSSRSGAASATQSNHIHRPPNSSGLHYKKDGTMDMRYNSSKLAASSATFNPLNQPSNSAGLHYKKDGTLDMRYASSRSTMNSYTSGGASTNHGIPKHVPLTKTGIPDMRTKAAKEWVKQQAQTGMKDIPSWLPKTKDGSLDISKPLTQEYLKWKDTSSIDYDPNQRLAYYSQKLEDTRFRDLVEDARTDEVETPQYEILPETQDIQRQLCSRPPTNYNTRQYDDDDDDYDQVPPERSQVQRHFPSQRMRYPDRHDDDEYDIRNEVSNSVPVINYRDLEIDPEDKLGQGSFGIVYKGRWNGQIVAIKQLHLNKLTRQEKRSFSKEIRIMSTLGEHPNLVRLYGYTLEPLCFVMEYVQLGSLSYLLHYCEDAQIEAKITDGRIKKKIILGIALGMIQLHKVFIVHGDLKPQNVLISEDYTAKITDFGFATLRGKTSSSIASSVTTSEDASQVCGTAGYMAPELLSSSKPPEYSSDVYAFGIMLNEMIQEEEPYADQFRNFLGRGPFAAVNYARLGNRPRISTRTSTFLKSFIEKCWHDDPRIRPSFEQIFRDLQPPHIKFPNSFDL